MKRELTEVLQSAGIGTNDDWELKTHLAEDGYKFTHKTEKLSVIVSINIEDDYKKWIHLSLARPDRMPDYNDLVNIRHDFLGNRKVIMVLPEIDKHVNIHPYCLHLFHCLDADSLPEFSGFRADIKGRTL